MAEKKYLNLYSKDAWSSICSIQLDLFCFSKKKVFGLVGANFGSSFVRNKSHPILASAIELSILALNLFFYPIRCYSAVVSEGSQVKDCELEKVVVWRRKIVPSVSDVPRPSKGSMDPHPGVVSRTPVVHTIFPSLSLLLYTMRTKHIRHDVSRPPYCIEECSLLKHSEARDSPYIRFPHHGMACSIWKPNFYTGSVPLTVDRTFDV